MNVEDLIYTIPNAFDHDICDHCIGYHVNMVSRHIATAGDTGFYDGKGEKPKESIDCNYGIAGTDYDMNIFKKMNGNCIWG